MSEEDKAMPDHEAARLTAEETRRKHLVSVEGNKQLQRKRAAAKRAKQARKKNRHGR